MMNQEKQAQRIIQAAQTVVLMYGIYKRQVIDNVTCGDEMFKAACAEMIRLLNNEIQFRNDWGDPVQLAYAIILTNEGYVPEA